ncbi:hypothetical protein CTAYLR_008497 [Chrysophaeum taylorii]|uniref:Uracil phosphoribosyltransferase n=1 Tax=Chrysophaeum taylorii TaxID=2483200 RepID=A0AAD7UA70_9STRA|nr:hypothetical protein CTAYLR_008497 [Chrysophaeum taylorii]
MSLRCVGLCGVDDSVEPSLLSAIGSRWVRAELGVLFRPGLEGEPRYPTREWCEKVANVGKRTSPPLRLAAHLCGRAVDAVLAGDVRFVKETLVPWGFRRVQLNATRRNGCTRSNLSSAAGNVLLACEAVPEVEWIIQANDETKGLWERVVVGKKPNLSLLWDASCGTGRKLDMSGEGAPPSLDVACGYAGGLNPQTIVPTLQEIRRTETRAIWVDMESGLRSLVDGLDRFDVNKAWAVCAKIDEEGWDVVAPALVAPEPVPPTTRVSGHAVLAHKVTLLRDRRTKPREFRAIMREITFYLGYEVTAKMPTAARHDCVAPSGVFVGAGARLAARVALVPIMRAGLGMVEPMLDILPNAAVHQVGMFKRGGPFDRPIEYYSRLPKRRGCDLAIILDPVIATSRTVHAVVSKVEAWGAKRVVVVGVLASRQGLEALYADHPNVDVHVAQVDGCLTSDGEMLPGLGDPGDRLFGAPGSRLEEEEEQQQQQVSAPPSVDDPSSEEEVPSASRAYKRPRTTEDRPSTTVLGPIVDGDEDAIEPPIETLDAKDSATQLTTHDGSFGTNPARMNWGAKTAFERGPVVATTRHTLNRNAIGAHAGGYSIYRALAVASGGLDTSAVPKLGLTTPAARIGPHDSWTDETKIVTMDPWGHAISEGFGAWLRKGYDVRPTIAVTKAHVELPECKEAMRLNRLTPDGTVLAASGTSLVTKAAIEPVWYLPGVAARFGVDERVLRDSLFAETNSMYPELITRPDLKLFLPPIGGMTVYVWGDPDKISDSNVELTCRVHDECNGSDVFGSDICTCRPYLTHAIEECIKTAQRGGVGIVVYFRKEGRALGEVTKYLVYNMRKRQRGGDRAAEYFKCTQSVAGVTDTRFQALMPDVLHWLGIKKIHRFISMSDMKYEAITKTGIEIVERVEIPPELVPADAQVEIAAKVHHGYHGGKSYEVDADKVNQVKGRDYY